MSLTRWDPFRDVEDVFDRYAKSLGWPLQRKSEMSLPDDRWIPRVDISETDTHFMIKAEVPGIKREEIKVDVESGILTIHGERKEEKEEKGVHFHRMERQYGRFSRRFSLPENVQADRVEANFKDGLLTLQVPKIASEKAKPIQVEIH